MVGQPACGSPRTACCLLKPRMYSMRGKRQVKSGGAHRVIHQQRSTRPELSSPNKPEKNTIILLSVVLACQVVFPLDTDILYYCLLYGCFWFVWHRLCYLHVFIPGGWIEQWYTALDRKRICPGTLRTHPIISTRGCRGDAYSNTRPFRALLCRHCCCCCYCCPFLCLCACWEQGWSIMTLCTTLTLGRVLYCIRRHFPVRMLFIRAAGHCFSRYMHVYTMLKLPMGGSVLLIVLGILTGFTVCRSRYSIFLAYGARHIQEHAFVRCLLSSGRDCQKVEPASDGEHRKTSINSSTSLTGGISSSVEAGSRATILQFF